MNLVSNADIYQRCMDLLEKHYHANISRLSDYGIDVKEKDISDISLQKEKGEKTKYMAGYSMKYKKIMYRVIASILILTMLMVDAVPRVAHAKTIDKVVEQIGKNLANDGIVLTTLSPNTSQDWAIAFKDGITGWSFFHNKVEAHIRKNNNGMAESELLIPGAGRYGTNGKADIYKVDDFTTYIWEVKPASHGFFPKKIFATKQVEKYAAASPFYEVGANNVIKNASFNVETVTGVVYEVKYANSLYNDGLIFYRFTRLGKKNPGQEPRSRWAPDH